MEESKVLRAFHDMDPSLPFGSRRSIGAPATLDELFDFDLIELGHVTTSEFLEAIRSQGVLPNNHSGHRIEDGLESLTEVVYLLSQYNALYAKRAVTNFGGEAVVLTVRVPIVNLAEDRNAFAPAWKIKSNHEALFHSLCFGVCVHHGSIPPTQIVSARYIDGRNAW